MFRRFHIAIAVAGCCIAIFAGCRVDPYAEVREREWRRLEEEIDYREGIISDLETQLDSCRRENDALRRRGATTTEPNALLPTPRVDMGDDNGLDTPPEELQDFQPPQTELGNEAPPPLGRLAPPRRRPVLLAANHQSAAAPAVEAQLPPADDATFGPAVSLKLNRRLTGGSDTDGHFGDEGIFALVEARDAAGNLVGDPGAMTLTLHDPMASGDRGVVAQWDFTAAEAAARFRAGPFGSGTHFELPWPNRPPLRTRLRLEVRLTTADGKTLSANQKFSVDLAGAEHAQSEGNGAEKPDSGPNRAATASDGLPPWRPTRR